MPKKQRARKTRPAPQLPATPSTNTSLLPEESTALAVNEAVVYELMDAADADLMVEELLGIVRDSDKPLAYSFLSGGTTVTGLTVTGIQEAVRLMATQARQGENGVMLVEVLRPMGKPDFQIIDLPSMGECCLCTITIGRYVVDVTTGREVFLDSAVGAKAQPYMQDTKYGPKPDGFFVEKAQSKAERNGKRKLLRPDVVSAVLKTALNKGLVQQRPPGNAAPQQAPQQRLEKADPISNDVAWLHAMGEAKKTLGDRVYYKVLGANGAEHANTVKDPKIRGTILQELKNEYKAKVQHENVQTAKAEGKPASSLFDGAGREPGE